jgi:hypothetical protein
MASRYLSAVSGVKAKSQIKISAEDTKALSTVKNSSRASPGLN